MKINRLASAIMRGTFLMDPRIVTGYTPNIISFLNGQKGAWFDDDDDDEDSSYIRAYFVETDLKVSKIERKASNGNIFESAPVGSVAIIPIQGTIMKDDNCGDPGTDTMSSWIKDARDAENITGVILKINSGGGTVEGTGEFAQLINEVNQVKPVVTYTEGIMASAAYWLGSSAREIFASHETVEIGSIGTCISFYDNREALQKWGYKSHYVNADDSIDKNQDFKKALDGDYSGLKINILNPTNDIFLSQVKSNRAGKLQLSEVEKDGKTYYEPLTGKMYLAQKAISIGLADGIKTFEQVIEHVQSTSAKSNKNKNNMSKFSKLSALAALGANATAEDIDLANADLTVEGITEHTIVAQSFINEASEATASLETANARIAELEGQLTERDASITSLTTAATTATETITSLTAERDTATARVTELESSLPGGPNKPNSKGDLNTSQKSYEQMNDLEKKAYKHQQIQEKKEKMGF